MKAETKDMCVEGKNVYLSGPMTSIRHNNAEAFARAHAMCRELGAHAVYNPAMSWLVDSGPQMSCEYYMRRTLRELIEREWDLVVMLEGWESSRGARVEHAVATAIGIDVVEESQLRDAYEARLG